MTTWNPYRPSWWQSALPSPPNPEDEWPVASPLEFPAAGPLPTPSASLPEIDNPRQDFSDVMFGRTEPMQWPEPSVPTVKPSMLSVHSDVVDSFERTFNDRYF